MNRVRARFLVFAIGLALLPVVMVVMLTVVPVPYNVIAYLGYGYVLVASGFWWYRSRCPNCGGHFYYQGEAWRNWKSIMATHITVNSIMAWFSACARCGHNWKDKALQGKEVASETQAPKDVGIGEPVKNGYVRPVSMLGAGLLSLVIGALFEFRTLPFLREETVFHSGRYVPAAEFAFYGARVFYFAGAMLILGSVIWLAGRAIRYRK